VIRVYILAETADEAQHLSALFADDEAIEITDAGAVDSAPGDAAGSSFGGQPSPSSSSGFDADATEPQTSSGLQPDVALVVGRATVAELPFERIPVVLLDDERAHSTAWWDPARSIHACLPLHASPREIAAALQAASTGLTLLTADQSDLVFQTTSPRAGSRASSASAAASTAAALPMLYEALTPRELQVLRMMAEGFANKEIAGQLGISDHTVKFHVASILGKLSAQTRTEAVTIGIRYGLVPV